MEQDSTKRTPSPGASGDARDRIVDEVTEKVEHKQSVHADSADIRSRSEEAVDQLLDKPVQTFTPLLAENVVTSDLASRDEDEGEDASQDDDRTGVT